MSAHRGEGEQNGRLIGRFRRKSFSHLIRRGRDARDDPLRDPGGGAHGHGQLGADPVGGNGREVGERHVSARQQPNGDHEHGYGSGGGNVAGVGDARHQTAESVLNGVFQAV